MTNGVLLATRDADLVRRVTPALERAGLVVEHARTNLELVWRLTGDRDAPAVIVVDARSPGLGSDPLLWLRDDPSPSCLVVLADGGLADAELAEAAATVSPYADTARIVREIVSALDGRTTRDLFRWTPPHGPPRLRPAARLASA